MPKECAINFDHIQTVSKGKIGALITSLDKRKSAEVGNTICFPYKYIELEPGEDLPPPPDPLICYNTSTTKSTFHPVSLLKRRNFLPFFESNIADTAKIISSLKNSV